MNTALRLMRTAGFSLAQALITVMGVVIIGFFLLNLLPGDAADAFAGSSGSASQETTAALRKSFGLDLPLFTRLISYLLNICKLDFGQSIHYQAPVLSVILSRLPSTFELMASAFVIAIVFGIGFGWIMAAFARRWPDTVLTSVLLLLYSAPGFWLGLMAIVLFSVRLNWLPSGGSETVGAAFSGLEALSDKASHLVLPCLALSLVYMAVYARLTRSALLEVFGQDFMRAAKAKGLHPIVLQFRHGLRNALIPVITVAGLHLGNLLGGAIIVETVFNWPGIGRLTIDALIARDFNILLGLLIISSALVVFSNSLIDVLVGILDPRIGSGS